MTYRITGLDPAEFAPLFALDDSALAAQRAQRVTAAASKGFPCRVSLRDADEGDELVLLHYANHAVDTPYRNAFAIYVRKDAAKAAEYVDTAPTVFQGRPIALRGYTAGGMLADARLALPGEADTAIRALLEDEAIAYIDAHNAAHGCFSARVHRHAA
jgi:hypothetical protein